jgi:hypothetical protein
MAAAVPSIRCALAMEPALAAGGRVMLKRVLLAALLSMSVAAPTLALADEAPQAAAAKPVANQTQAKAKTSHKSRKNKSTGHQGRKGSRSGRRGMKRSAKSVQQAR